MSRGLALPERFLAESGFDRGPWLAVGFACGIAAWFGLDEPGLWIAFGIACLGLSLVGLLLLRAEGEYPHLRQALIALPLVMAMGLGTVWSKSALVGEPPIERPMVVQLDARVLERQEQPAQDRVRLVLAALHPDSAEPTRIRINVPRDFDRPELTAPALVRVRVRLMPPSPPMLPGAYNFARTAWFQGFSATGTAIEPVQVLSPGKQGGGIRAIQLNLSRHVRDRLEGSGGGIAATLASGDRGAIADADAEAMRDAGLAHLLSISGLHVSAVIAAAYLLAIRLLALWTWLALRVRLPILAAAAAAGTGIGYTLLTGAQVPTVRSCIGALLVLAALALGREALSLRMLAVAAFLVLLFWPESLMGPSFQMSFAAVMTIVALNGSDAVRHFLAPREEGWPARAMRYFAMLFLTGLLIEIVLMPIGFYHFHRAGVYGAFANVIAIPLTTLLIMPAIALALLLDLVGSGAPAWWIAGKGIDVVLGVAHWVAARPGAVTLLPAMGGLNFLLFVAGGLWLALWRGRARLLGLVPAMFGSIGLIALQPPDILVSGDGRHVGITLNGGEDLLMLRDSRSEFVRDNISELAGMRGKLQTLADWNGARCNADFCVASLDRGGREWHLLIARGRDQVPERALAAACDRADIVIADRWLPRSCKPRWFKADRSMLARTGGLAIDLESHKVRTVADEQGGHGWWRGVQP